MNLVIGTVVTLTAISTTTTAAIVLASAVHHRGGESTFARQARLDREREASLLDQG